MSVNMFQCICASYSIKLSVRQNTSNNKYNSNNKNHHTKKYKTFTTHYFIIKQISTWLQVTIMRRSVHDTWTSHWTDTVETLRCGAQTHKRTYNHHRYPSSLALGHTGDCSLWHECFLKTFQCSGQASSVPTAQGNGHGCVRSFGPGPVLLQVRSPLLSVHGELGLQGRPGTGVCVCVLQEPQGHTAEPASAGGHLSHELPAVRVLAVPLDSVVIPVCVCAGGGGQKGCQNGWKTKVKFLISFLNISKIRQYLMLQGKRTVLSPMATRGRNWQI